jgi:hypothetical protein
MWTSIAKQVKLPRTQETELPRSCDPDPKDWASLGIQMPAGDFLADSFFM